MCRCRSKCLWSYAVERHTVLKLLREQQIKVMHTFGSGSDNTDIAQESRRKNLEFYKGDIRVEVTKVHCFYGRESKALVVEIPNANTLKALALAYTGCTRLKWNDLGSYLTVVNSQDSAHDTHTPSADQDHNIHFRIHALIHHGSCVDGCPPTTF